ncbi:TetR/AcrR family transcriptional regulator [Nocardioides sp. GY 10127]|uniref:TetR/AcrR family transcriptional regulator n=1 Tax=Nocardioides sp. GY 10127 TaxID=2569762 RepID=UPI0010A8C859|nr:TetR/AcrR family transcriptional regulator [Nocardioides sp. GY 10127]TIC82902.1 TetR/AcrR family transcriptional regulator [Nocardioides sp. GY 10127]
MDARQRRSRERLHRAVLALAQERPVASLSVTEVAAEAGVHRTTFYEHATSPFALLEQALVEQLDAFRTGLLDQDTPVEQAVSHTTRSVLVHVRDHLAVYRQGLADDAGPSSLHAMLARHFAGSTRELVRAGRIDLDVHAPGIDDDLAARAAERFLADATVGVIAVWIQAPEQDVDAFMSLFERLLPQWWTVWAAQPVG